jgi:Pyridoxamine 5'-phosphate oxidase
MPLRSPAAMTSFPEAHRDLLAARFASLATLGGDGIPRVTEAWFLLDEDESRLSLNTSRLKTRNLLKGPQRSLCSSTFRTRTDASSSTAPPGSSLTTTTPSPASSALSATPTSSSTTAQRSRDGRHDRARQHLRG